MIRVVLFVAALAAAVMVAVWFANDPGEVTVLWRGWRVDTSVGILLFTMVLSVLVILGVAKIIAIIRGTAQGFAMARKDRRITQGLAALGHGLAAVNAGQPQAARKFAKEASALLDDNAATRMLNAQAAAANDDGPGLRSVAVNLLEKPETELSALRDLAARAQKEGDVVGALNYAKRALARKDAPKWALETVLDVQVANGRWVDALAAVDSKLGRDHLGADAHKKIKAELFTRAAEEALDHGDAAAAESHARKSLDTILNERALVCHARALMLQGKQKKAMAEIEKAWALYPSAAMLRAYHAAVPGESSLDWARRVEKLVASAADHAESRLGLAESSLRAQLWGQARNRLSPLLGDDTPRAIHARAAMLMAELETTERNDTAAGAVWLKRALEHSQPGSEAARLPPRSVNDLLTAKT